MKRLSFVLLSLSFLFASCNFPQPEQQKSDSGVTKASIKIKTGVDGLTAEQRNITMKNERDAEPGSVKFAYVISAYTGDVLEQSTVKCKVTSGGKRLSPKTVIGDSYQHTSNNNWVNIGGTNFTTNEVLDELGTYGESANYIYWEDAGGNYHQYFPSGGTYLHISDKPLRVKKSVVTFEPLEEPATKKELPPTIQKNN